MTCGPWLDTVETAVVKSFLARCCLWVLTVRCRYQGYFKLSNGGCVVQHIWQEGYGDEDPLVGRVPSLDPPQEMALLGVPAGRSRWVTFTQGTFRQ